MYAGGSSHDNGKKVSLCITDDGKVYGAIHSAAPRLLYSEHWWNELQRNFPDILSMISSGLFALKSDLKTPLLVERFFDAVAWVGDAMREKNSASRLVKYVTAIERMTSISSQTNISEAICNRAASFVSIVFEEDFLETKRNYKNIYNFRSRLLHGSASPNELILSSKAFIAEELARKFIIAALTAYHNDGFLREDVTEEMLEQFHHQTYERLMAQNAEGD